MTQKYSEDKINKKQNLGHFSKNNKIPFKKKAHSFKREKQKLNTSLKLALTTNSVHS